MSDEEQKEEKPKKMFTVVHTCWDDGEIDTEMYEFRKNASGRGAPGKWRLNGPDFNRRVGEILGDPDGVAEEMAANMQLGTPVLPTGSVSSLPVQPKQEKKAKKRPAHLDDEEAGMLDSPIVPVEDDKPSDSLEDIDFGEHDKDK